jgi:hypothetical protein
MYLLRVLELEGEEQTYRFKRVLSAAHVVSKEKIVEPFDVALVLSCVGWSA